MRADSMALDSTPQAAPPAMRTRISIVIPCYNHGQYLGEAIDSARRIGRDDIEIIVVDDGSTDSETESEMNSVRKGGVSVIRQENRGLAAARNAGIMASRGDYILPLDADNLVRPEYVSDALTIMDANPRTGVVYGDANYIGDKTGRWHVGPFDMDRLLRWNYIDACTVYRRSVWEQNGGYDPTLPVQGFEDWDFWLGAVQNGWEFAYVPKVLFDYRISEGSMRARMAGHEAEIAEFILAKHRKLYAQRWFELRDNTSFRAALRHTVKLFRVKLGRKVAEAISSRH